jgi:hypothetical protein
VTFWVLWETPAPARLNAAFHNAAYAAHAPHCPLVTHGGSVSWAELQTAPLPVCAQAGCSEILPAKAFLFHLPPLVPIAVIGVRRKFGGTQRA